MAGDRADRCLELASAEKRRGNESEDQRQHLQPSDWWRPLRKPSDKFDGTASAFYSYLWNYGVLLLRFIDKNYNFWPYLDLMWVFSLYLLKTPKGEPPFFPFCLYISLLFITLIWLQRIENAVLCCASCSVPGLLISHLLIGTISPHMVREHCVCSVTCIPVPGVGDDVPDQDCTLPLQQNEILSPESSFPGSSLG